MSHDNQAVAPKGPVEFVRSVPNKQISDQAKAMFPNNKYQRLSFHAWANTVRKNETPVINPSSYVLNIVGDPGYGKSGMTYGLVGPISAWLTEGCGTPVIFEIITRTLAGIVDISDLVGIPNVNKEEQCTMLYPPKSFPKGDERNRVGVIFCDDLTRASNEGIMSGFMEFTCTRRINDYKLPPGFGLVAATNPQGKNNKVRSLDDAQWTRFIPVAYAPSYSVFMEQLVLQGVGARLIAYFHKFRDMIPKPAYKDLLPTPRPVNWRNSTIFAHMMDTCQYDDELQTMLIQSIFGDAAVTNLSSVLDGECPFEASEIIGLLPEQIAAGGHGELAMSPEEAMGSFPARLRMMEAAKQLELISLSTTMLCVHVNNLETIDFTPQQFDNLCTFLDMLPGPAFGDFTRRVLSTGCKHKEVFCATQGAHSMLSWKREGGGMGKLAQRVMDRNKDRQQVFEEIEKKQKEQVAGR